MRLAKDSAIALFACAIVLVSNPSGAEDATAAGEATNAYVEGLIRSLGAKAPEAKLLELDLIPRLAEDIRAEKGYLLKVKKRFRIDETLSDLIDLLDTKRTLKQVINELSKARKIPATTAFVYSHQLYDEGVIEMSKPTDKKSRKSK